MNVFEFLMWLVLCHLIGDYVLQSDYIATTRGKNWYHLFVHSALYCVPFAFLFTYLAVPGYITEIGYLFISHFILDMAKARYDVISIVEDQAIHYVLLVNILYAVDAKILLYV